MTTYIWIELSRDHSLFIVRSNTIEMSHFKFGLTNFMKSPPCLGLEQGAAHHPLNLTISFSLAYPYPFNLPRLFLREHWKCSPAAEVADTVSESHGDKFTSLGG